MELHRLAPQVSPPSEGLRSCALWQESREALLVPPAATSCPEVAGLSYLHLPLVTQMFKLGHGVSGSSPLVSLDTDPGTHAFPCSELGFSLWVSLSLVGGQ